MSWYPLDLRSVVFLIAAGNALAAMVLALHRGATRVSRTYIAARACQAAGWLLIWQIGSVPLWLNFLAANVLLELGFSLEALAVLSVLRRRRGVEAFYAIWFVIIVAGTSIRYASSFTAAELNRVNLEASLYAMVIFAVPAVLLARDAAASRFMRTLAFLYAAFSLSLLGRIVVLLAAREPVRLFAPNLVQSFLFVAVSAVLMFGTLAYVLLLTERTMQKLQASEESYRLLADHVSDMVSTHRRDGTIVFVSPSCKPLVGYAPEELRGRALSDFVDPESLAQLRAMLRSFVRREGRPVTFRVPRKDGTRIWLESVAQPISAGLFVAVSRDVSERQSLNEQLREESIRDPLTGLYNRRYLQESLPRDAAHAVRAGLPLIVVLLDVDGFKEVNDRAGHEAGDALLCAVARTLSSQVRSSDLVCRMGGDEFLVLLRSTEPSAAISLCERWRMSLSTPGNGDGAVAVGVSIGIALFRAGEETIEETVRRADGALYEAKRQGRNRVVLAEG